MATVTSANPPRHYLLLLYPGFELLDVAGPLNILRQLSTFPAASDITLTVAAETKHPVSTAPRAPPGADWKFPRIPDLPQAEDGGAMASVDPRMGVDVTFDECLASLRATPGQVPDGRGGLASVDVLIVPGGIGSRLQRIPAGAGVDDLSGATSNIAPTLAFIDDLTPRVTQAILTVCTGSHVLAQSWNGRALNGRLATTNMLRYGFVTGKNKHVAWTPARWVRSYAMSDPRCAAQESEEWIVDLKANKAKHIRDIEVWTSAGISAGMDLTLAFVAEVYGVDTARTIAERLEYEWREVAMGEKDPIFSKLSGC